MTLDQGLDIVGEFARSSAYFGLFISVGTYMIGLALRKRLRSPLCNPLLIAIVATIVVMEFCRVDYQSYDKSAGMLSYLLTPATICLAIPLYRQYEELKKNWKVVVAAIMTGCAANCALVFIVTKAFHLEHSAYVTFLVKSITTAIGMGIADELGGDVAIAVVTIILTGLTGAVLGEKILALFHITHPIAKGLAIGSSSHAIGTARALELGDDVGAASGLAVAVTGILTAILAPFFAGLY